MKRIFSMLVVMVYRHQAFRTFQGATSIAFDPAPEAATLLDRTI